MDFDVEATFGDDYLYFYAESTDEGHSDDDAAEILGRLGLPPGSRILDVPCGTGRISRRLASAGFDVTGVDLSASFIALAEAEPVGPVGPGGHLAYHRGDLRQLPVPGPFDAVVCWFTSFGYYDDADCRRVLAEFHRVLRPGGTVLIETMHHDGVVRHFTAAPDATVRPAGRRRAGRCLALRPADGTDRRPTARSTGTARSATAPTSSAFPRRPNGRSGWRGPDSSDVRSSAGGGGPLDLDSWVMVVEATA